MPRYTIIFTIVWSLLFLSADVAHAEFMLSTSVRADLFTETDTSDITGEEVTIPIGFTYRDDRLNLSCGTAYSRSQVNWGSNSEAELTAFTDAYVSGSYVLSDLSTGMVIGVDINLPLGKERLTTTEQMAEAGKNNDLLEIDDFGQGLNIGVNFGLTQDLNRLGALGVNAAYIFMGEYDPTADFDNDTLDPGDKILLAGQYKWLISSTASSWMTAEIFGNYLHTFEETQNGQSVFQEGGQFFAGGTMQTYNSGLQLTLLGQYVFRMKNKESVGGVLKTESANSNGPAFFGSVDALLKFSPRFAMRVLADVRYYDESIRKDATSGIPFEGRRIRYAAGPGFEYSLTRYLSLNGLVKYLTLTEEKSMLLDEQVTYHGGNLSFGITYRF